VQAAARAPKGLTALEGGTMDAGSISGKSHYKTSYVQQ
jgi:hypothetical protein